MVPVDQDMVPMEKESIHVGAHVWIPDDIGCWLGATVISSSEVANEITVELVDSGIERSIPIEVFRKVALPRNASLGEERIDDLTGLAFLHEASVLNTIKSRYVDNSIYTYSGIVLTAVNPYSRLPLYEREIIWAYRERHREELSPHLFAIAEDALCSLCLHHQSQSIIVSGESGAGKTISAKYIMRYLAEVCAMGTPSLLPLDEPKVRKTTVEDRVLATNPILEAFGNAKTIRNDNSSRFGKYIQIFFNDQDLIAGAAIKTYLLEKTRVVIQAEEERNFHIFYQLLAGCPEMERSELELYSWDEFEFLSRSGCGYIDGVDDVEEFKVTRDAMAIAGFTEDHQWNIFRVLAAILHLGNLQFTEDSDGHAHIKEAGALERVAKLLGVESAALEQDLIRRKIVAAHETVDAFNNLIQATASRDALSKLLYSSLFNHIVDGLNVNLMPTDKCDRFIGVLDIYGFERFNVNSFEQFCINYANEKLQNSFNKHVFELEQKLYDEEGIDWSFVHFYDNQKCIDLIESKLGVMDLLDEECRFPNGSDSSFVAKLYDRQGKMETGTFLLKPKISSEDKFTVKHFAYDVEYTTTGFIEKNRDQVPTELLELMSNSSNEFVKTLLQHSASSQSLLASRDSLSISRGRPSTGMTFKASLNSLMEVISSTRSHYIRCIKPNEGKEAMVFDAPFVVQQLCACGILETVRISSAGYPGRWPFQDFLDRFKLLSSDPISITTMDDTRMACCTLLSEFNMTNEQYQVGKTRVFMRAGVLAALEDARMRRLCTASTTIQSILRRLLAMTRMMEAFAAIMKIEQMIRMKLGWNHHRSLALARATDRIMAIIQRFIGIKLMDDGRRASNFISCIFKYFTTKLKSRELYKELSSQEIVNILRFFLTRRLYKAQIMISLAVQSRYRRNIAWLELLKLREEARSVEHLKETSEILEKRITDLEHQLKLANEHLTYERQVNGRLNADLVAARESTKVIIPDEDLQILRNELDDARLRIESFEKMIDSLEMANNELFERNEELAKQLRVYRLERTNADRLGKASQQQSLANIILRDTETPPRSLHHLRALSYDSRLEMLGDLALPEIMRPAEIRATSADMADIRMALDDGGCLTELLQVVERAKIPRTPDERAIKSISRLPCRIFERWILCWLRVGSNPTIVKSFLERVLHHVKLNCTSVQSHLINRGRSQTVPHEGGSITVSADRRLSFWIANLFEFLGFLQWAVSDVNDSDSDGRDQGEGQNGALSERILTLLQLRTDVARVVEELYRAWLTDLFRQLSKLGVAALLDHQGLTGFTSDPQQHPQEPQSSLKLLMIPFAKLTTGGGLGERLPGIDDLVESLDELADSMEASHLHPEIAIQLFSSVISHFCAAAFNQLLLRKNYATWKRGIQIQYNLSRLEEWANTLQAKNPGYFFSSSTAASPTGLIPSSMAATTTSPLWQIEPLIQAVKLLQLAKTKVATDLDLLLEAAPRLNLAQIRKILSVYVPDAYEDGPVSPEVLRGMTARIQQVQYELKGQLVETLPEPQPLSLPLQLSMRPVTPVPFSSLPTAAVPPHLWKIFALIDSTC